MIVDATDQPAVRVSWHEATQFCERLSEKTGLRVVLPTEANGSGLAGPELKTYLTTLIVLGAADRASNRTR